MALISSTSDAQINIKISPAQSSSSSMTLRPARIRIRPKLKVKTKVKSKAKGKDRAREVQSREDVGQSNNLPKQSSHTTRILFDTIGPHVELRTLQHLTKQLSQIVSYGHDELDTQDRDGKKMILKRRLGMIFGTLGSDGRRKRGNSEKSEESAANYSWSLKAHPWIEPTIYSYFMGKLLDKPYKNHSSDSPQSYRENPTYPPNINRLKRDNHIQTLIKTRDVSLRKPIFWTEKAMRESGYSLTVDNQDPEQPLEMKHVMDKQEIYLNRLVQQHSHKSDAQLQSEAKLLLEVLESNLPPKHFHKLMGVLEGFIRLDKATAPVESQVSDGGGQNDNSSWCIDDDSKNESSSPLPSLPESRAAHTDWKKHRIPILGKFLSNCSPSHSHLVAFNLGRFLYMELPGPTVQGEKSVGEKKLAAFAIQKQRKLQSAENKYQKAQGDFIQKMIELQHQFSYWRQASDTGEKVQGYSDGNDLSHCHDAKNKNISDVDSMSPDLMVGELNPLKQAQLEDLSEMMDELQQTGLRSKEDEKKSKKKRGRPRKDTHLYFTAIKVEKKDDKLASAIETPSHEAALKERLVFVNNLPIDTTVEEMDEIYSRCGPLESIELFNLRPDLDPGPLSKSQLEERRRKNKLRNRNVFTPYSKLDHRRPRTPVYGMLRFKTDTGYQVATSPELCIFGCVIRRHPVMSIKSQDLTTLYLENIPNLYSMDVEHNLAGLFRPLNIHVMLDGMKGVGAKNGSGMAISVNEDYQEYSKPLSCQLKFEDFHTAYQAFHLIKEKDSDIRDGEGISESILGSSECQLHWFQTPENSMEYWTRELNF